MPKQIDAEPTDRHFSMELLDKEHPAARLVRKVLGADYCQSVYQTTFVPSEYQKVPIDPNAVEVVEVHHPSSAFPIFCVLRPGLTPDNIDISNQTTDDALVVNYMVSEEQRDPFFSLELTHLRVQEVKPTSYFPSEISDYQFPTISLKKYFDLDVAGTKGYNLPDLLLVTETGELNQCRHAVSIDQGFLFIDFSLTTNSKTPETPFSGFLVVSPKMESSV